MKPTDDETPTSAVAMPTWARPQRQPTSERSTRLLPLAPTHDYRCACGAVPTRPLGWVFSGDLAFCPRCAPRSRYHAERFERAKDEQFGPESEPGDVA